MIDEQEFETNPEQWVAIFGLVDQKYHSIFAVFPLPTNELDIPITDHLELTDGENDLYLIGICREKDSDELIMKYTPLPEFEEECSIH